MAARLGLEFTPRNLGRAKKEGNQLKSLSACSLFGV
jgi:hypothetical protein